LDLLFKSSIVNQGSSCPAASAEGGEAVADLAGEVSEHRRGGATGGNVGAVVVQAARLLNEPGGRAKHQHRSHGCELIHGYSTPYVANRVPVHRNAEIERKYVGLNDRNCARRARADARARSQAGVIKKSGRS